MAITEFAGAHAFRGAGARCEFEDCGAGQSAPQHRGTKSAPQLTVTKATSQARRHVDRIMPGVMATVESRLSHDLESDTPTVITTVTFPEGQDGQLKLVRALDSLTGSHGYVWAGSSIVLTRTR